MKKIIGEKLKAARKAHGLTQYKLAEMAKISRVYYADVERGRYNPSVKVLASLASVLDIDLNFIKNDGNTEQ